MALPQAVLHRGDTNEVSLTDYMWAAGESVAQVDQNVLKAGRVTFAKERYDLAISPGVSGGRETELVSVFREKPLTMPY